MLNITATNKMTSRNIVRVLILIVAAAVGAWLSFRISTPPPQPATATVLPAPGALPEFSLQDQRGRPVGRDDFLGQWSLVFFGFTHCPDICPMTLQVLASVREQLSNQGFKPLPRIVLVSVDPERDTPEAIGQYVDYFGEDNVGITGSIEELRKLTGGLGIYFEKSPLEFDATNENYSVDHSAVVLVINPRGQFHALFSAPHTIENFTNDLPLIMANY
jgi:protein SCO1/2